MRKLLKFIVSIFNRIILKFPHKKAVNNKEIKPNPKPIKQEYKTALKQMLIDFNGNLAITFAFNKEASCGITSDLIEKIIRKWNCLFFSKIYGARFYKHYKIKNIHTIEHLKSNIHTHSVYKIDDEEYIKDPKAWILKYEKLANKLFNNLWPTGTVYMDKIRDEGWFDYMIKENHSREDLSYFILP